jgi:hypothetical protein
MQVRFACTGAFKEGKLERAVTFLVSRAQVHCADRSLDGISSNLQQEQQQQQQGGAAASSQVPSALGGEYYIALWVANMAGGESTQ